MKIKTFHKMRKTWSHDDILSLLGLWNIYEKELKALKRNSHIYDKIAALLRSRGVDATSSEVHFKINNLKQRYRKDELYGLTSWRYFENVKEILQDKSCIKQESGPGAGNDYAISRLNQNSPEQIPSTTANACSASPLYELSSSNSLSNHILPTSFATRIPPNSSSNSIPTNSVSNPIPPTSSSNTISQNITSTYTEIPPSRSSNSIPQSGIPRSKCVESLANENHCNADPTTGRRKKSSLKRALLNEIRRGNDIAARDQEVTERLLTQANEINQEWNRLLKELMNRSLAILERSFVAKETDKTA